MRDSASIRFILSILFLDKISALAKTFPSNKNSTSPIFSPSFTGAEISSGTVILFSISETLDFSTSRLNSGSTQLSKTGVLPLFTEIVLSSSSFTRLFAIV